MYILVVTNWKSGIGADILALGYTVTPRARRLNPRRHVTVYFPLGSQAGLDRGSGCEQDIFRPWRAEELQRRWEAVAAG